MFKTCRHGSAAACGSEQHSGEASTPTVMNKEVLVLETPQSIQDGDSSNMDVAAKQIDHSKAHQCQASTSLLLACTWSFSKLFQQCFGLRGVPIPLLIFIIIIRFGSTPTTTPC